MSRIPDKYNNRHETGFTLVEALVSLVLLTTALVPAFILATDALKLSTGIRNTLIASSLAQEGVELVRAIRDANWFASRPFNTGLDTCFETSGCRVQWDWTAVQALEGNPPLKLEKDSGLYQSGLYQYSNGTDSPFSRMITISPVPGSVVELVVKSTVTWVERETPKTMVVEYHMFDWIK